MSTQREVLILAPLASYTAALMLPDREPDVRFDLAAGIHHGVVSDRSGRLQPFD